VGLSGGGTPRRSADKPVSHHVSIRPEILQQILNAKGFLSMKEGLKLFELAQRASGQAPCLEIGSYCGKSSLFLAEGCRAAGGYGLFSVDHHRGSQEQQPGQEYFDGDLYDPSEDRINTLPHFLRNLEQAGLLSWVIPMVGESTQVARNWTDVKLSLVFIDGGHSESDVSSDYECWSPYVVHGGYLCFHDIYPNPDNGGQAPFRVFEHVRSLSNWCFVGLFESLGVLQRR
jgi:predicted O-methyltransferase YrrM